jgi:hypothetical protein
MAFSVDGKTLTIIILIAAIVYILFFKPQESTFVLEGAPIDGSSEDTSKPVNFIDSVKQMFTSGKETDVKTTGEKSIGVVEQPGDVIDKPSPSAALLPNEVPVTEDFGQFSTEKIMSGQNYLDPRNQVGYPETVGGTLRNANLQIRSEPANPRESVSIWNMSTITRDDETSVRNAR